MKLIHTSDWHLGMLCRNGQNYADDQRFFVNQICETARREGAEGVIIAGDIFDKSIASQEAITLYDEAMTKLCNEYGLKVYIVAGNHDGAERLAQCNTLLRNSGLFIAGSLKAEPQVVNEGSTDIYLLPWISTDRVKSAYPDEAELVTSLEAAYQLVLDKYRAGFIPGHKNILVSHAFVVGAETSTSDRSAVVGNATMVGSFVFDGFDYVALGHIHGPQSIRENIRYSGTPMAYSFGTEEHQVKSVTLIDTDTGEQKIIPIPILNKRTTIKGKYEDILAAEYPKEILDGYVRLEIEDCYVGMEAIALLREKYSQLLEVSGKSFDSENEQITMTMDEFEAIESDPQAIFARYCQDVIGREIPERLTTLFLEALKKYEQEGNEE